VLEILVGREQDVSTRGERKLKVSTRGERKLKVNTREGRRSQYQRGDKAGDTRLGKTGLTG
jgi:hypothetical protein